VCVCVCVECYSDETGTNLMYVYIIVKYLVTSYFYFII
jgi:hypothetical protein